MPRKSQRSHAPWAVVAGAIVACATARPAGAPQSSGYLGKGGRCDRVAAIAGSAAVLKAQVRSRGPNPSGGRPEPERVIAFVISAEVAPLGWTPADTLAFAKAIDAAGPYPDVATEILAASLYFGVACKLETRGTPVRPYPDLTSQLRACLGPSAAGAQQACAASAMQ